MKYLSIALIFWACNYSQNADWKVSVQEIPDDLDSTYIVNAEDRVIFWDTVTTDTFRMAVTLDEISGNANGRIFFEKLDGSEWMSFQDYKISNRSRPITYEATVFKEPNTAVRVRIKTTGTQLIKATAEYK